MLTYKQRSRFAVASTAPAEWPHMTAAALLSAIAVPLIGLLIFVRTPLLLPLISVTALGGAVAIAFVAWCMSADRHSHGISLWDVSGAYAFVGFAAGMLSDPQQVVDFWLVSAGSPESTR